MSPVYCSSSFNPSPPRPFPASRIYLKPPKKAQSPYTHLLREGHFQEAKDLAEVDLKHAPNDPRLLMILAYAESGLQDGTAAVKHITQAVAQAPPEKRIEMKVALWQYLCAAGKNRQSPEDL